jgi:hypothetical protein
MAETSTVIFKVSVLRCRKSGRVLFLEAGKDFVDTLSLLETRCLNNATNVAEYTRFVQLSPLPNVVTTLVQT